MYKKDDKVMVSKGFYFGVPSTMVGIVRESNKNHTVVFFPELGNEQIKTKHLQKITRGE